MNVVAPQLARRLTSARLILDPTGSGDAADVIALHRDPRVVRYLIDGIPDEPWKFDRYLDWATALHRRGIGPWSARRTGSGEFVGMFTLTPYRNGDDSLLELGGRLARRGWSGGLAFEAGRCLIDHAFGELGHDRLMSAHHPENPTVPALLERLHFRSPEPATVFGNPAVAWQLRRPDWAQAHATGA